MGRLETEKVLTCEVETVVSNKKGEDWQDRSEERRGRKSCLQSACCINFLPALCSLWVI